MDASKSPIRQVNPLRHSRQYYPLTDESCFAFSRSKVRQCIPLGLSPAGFAIPAPHPSRRRMVSARAPPLWEMQGVTMGEDEPQAQLAPEYEFDQRIAW